MLKLEMQVKSQVKGGSLKIGRLIRMFVDNQN